jgi:hypothetical protein
MTNEVIDLLTALRDGTMNIDEVARRFRERSWPRRDSPRPTTYLELAARAQEDPDPYIPGSFDDVAAAFHRGDLSNGQYDVLAHAMAESMRAEDRRKGAESAGSP